jgi:adenosylcobinamide-GDP ribazoletransferase
MRKMRQYFDKLKALKFSPLKFKKAQKSPPQKPQPPQAAPAKPAAAQPDNTQKPDKTEKTNKLAWDASWLQRTAQGIRHLLLAVQFFTRIPLGKRLADWVGFSPEMQRASTAYFPVVGMLVGGVVVALSVVLFGTMQFNLFTPLVVAVLGTAISAWLTGALHEDGLADTADALGGYVSREKALEIMKDSRIGTYGMVGLGLVVLGKISLLAFIGASSPTPMLLALVLGHTVSRFWPLCVIYLLSYAGEVEQSKAPPLAEPIETTTLATGAAWCMAALLLALIAFDALSFMAIGAGFLASMLGFSAMLSLLHRRLQGFTGDGLGATQQITELAFYLGIAMTMQ